VDIRSSTAERDHSLPQMRSVHWPAGHLARRPSFKVTRGQGARPLVAQAVELCFDAVRDEGWRASSFAPHTGDMSTRRVPSDLVTKY
jgi:hypothetical protein